MRKMHKLCLEFNGTVFEGWQKQTRTNNTIQGQLESSLAKIFKQQVLVKGSGRTDSGVHAKNFVVVFEKPFEIPNQSLVKALNSHLPNSILVKSCEETEVSSPTSEAKSRTYKYFFTNLENPSPFVLDFMSNISYPLNFEAMQAACDLFIGEHDFMSFHTKGSDPSTTVRTIYSCEIHKFPSSMEGIVPEHFVITIKGSGFLKQMVRLIVASIWDVGRGKLDLDSVRRALKDASGQHLSAVSPPNGLVKFSVDY